METEGVRGGIKLTKQDYRNKTPCLKAPPAVSSETIEDLAAKRIAEYWGRMIDEWVRRFAKAFD